MYVGIELLDMSHWYIKMVLKFNKEKNSIMQKSFEIGARLAKRTAALHWITMCQCFNAFNAKVYLQICAQSPNRHTQIYKII